MPVVAPVPRQRDLQQAALPLVPGEVVHVGAVVGRPVREVAPHQGGALGEGSE